MSIGRRVFFSFHYERDAWRAANVRNSQQFPVKGALGRFSDAADWEAVKRQGDAAIRRWIREQLQNTSVTVVLIGAKTSTRDWVKYEIEQSIDRGNGLLGVHIHNIEDSFKNTDSPGSVPVKLQGYSIYNWYGDDGRAKLGKWIEDAARAAGR